jgi:phenylacetate-CoA ligase
MIKKSINKIISIRRGTNFDLEYSKFKSLTDEVKLSEFQEKYLKKLLLHAYKNVLYYHRVFDEIGLINDGRVDLSKFNKIPILTKDIIRKNQKELVCKDYTKRNWHYHDSGGSTGEPISIVHDDDIYPLWLTAAEHYYYANMLNIDEFDSKKIIIWGLWRDLFQGNKSLKAKINNWLKNKKLLNCLKMTEDCIERYIAIINSYKPDIIRGYSSSLYELCKHAEKKNLTVYTPQIIISAAETLLPEMRQKIETVFGTKVYNFYGAREVASIAGECKEGLMHIFSFYNYVEILDIKDQSVNNGEEGRVIITNLYNYLMPLIRYEICDMAVLGPKRCKCGNVLPTLEKVTGRITDWFVKEDGTTISPIFFMYLFMTKYRKRFLKKFQIIQEDYKKIRILIVPENSKEMPQKDIEEKIKQMMGKDCRINWEFVDEIPKTKSGKYIYIKSLVWGQK